MDAITLVVTALVTGAGKVVAEDAYKGLKTLIQQKFAGKPEAEIALAQHEQTPKVWEEPLKNALVEAGVDQDEAILKAAQALMQALDPEGAAAGTYTVNITGNVYGVVGENKGIVNQTFKV